MSAPRRQRPLRELAGEEQEFVDVDGDYALLYSVSDSKLGMLIAVGAQPKDTEHGFSALMTPSQARAYATAIIMCADQVDPEGAVRA